MLKIKRDDEVIVIAGKDVVAVLPHPVQQLRRWQECPLLSSPVAAAVSGRR